MYYLFWLYKIPWHGRCIRNIFCVSLKCLHGGDSVQGFVDKWKRFCLSCTWNLDNFNLSGKRYKRSCSPYILFSYIVGLAWGIVSLGDRESRPSSTVKRGEFPTLSYFYKLPVREIGVECETKNVWFCHSIYNHAVFRLGYPGGECDTAVAQCAAHQR